MARRKNEVCITLINAIGEKAEVLTLNVSFRDNEAGNRKDNGPTNIAVLRRRDATRLD